MYKFLLLQYDEYSGLLLRMHISTISMFLWTSSCIWCYWCDFKQTLYDSYFVSSLTPCPLYPSISIVRFQYIRINFPDWFLSTVHHVCRPRLPIVSARLHHWVLSRQRHITSSQFPTSFLATSFHITRDLQLRHHGIFWLSSSTHLGWFVSQRFCYLSVLSQVLNNLVGWTPLPREYSAVWGTVHIHWFSVLDQRCTMFQPHHQFPFFCTACSPFTKTWAKTFLPISLIPSVPRYSKVSLSEFLLVSIMSILGGSLQALILNSSSHTTLVTVSTLFRGTGCSKHVPILIIQRSLFPDSRNHRLTFVFCFHHVLDV